MKNKKRKVEIWMGGFKVFDINAAGIEYSFDGRTAKIYPIDSDECIETAVQNILIIYSNENN
jgi:hypothetical protein